MSFNDIYSVSALVTALKQMAEKAFPFAWVRGQVANLSRPASGHIFFTLIDAQADSRTEGCPGGRQSGGPAALPVVWFRGRQRAEESFDPLTGEVYASGPKPGLAALLDNGQEVLCAGAVSVYAPRGALQLEAELVRDEGLGRRQLVFELLKAELAGKGYFDPRRKRLLPAHPRRVALITSPGGAAVHDFLRLAQGRGLAAELRIYPSLVQGAEAPARIARAFALAREEGWAEVVVLLRGGGSQEDLGAFNTREVAEAVYSCPWPVLCGVGHEVDVTLADLTADLRASTPSHAAQLLLLDRRELFRSAREAGQSLRLFMDRALRSRERELAMWEKSLGLLSPAGRLERGALRLRALVERLEAAGRDALRGAELRLERQALRLSGLDPHLPLERGYVLARRPDGRLLRARAEAAPGEELEVLFRDGPLPVRVRGGVEQ